MPTVESTNMAIVCLEHMHEPVATQTVKLLAQPQKE